MNINEAVDQNTDTTHRKMDAEIAKLIAETSKINSENRFYPIVITATAIIAIVAVVQLIPLFST